MAIKTITKWYFGKDEEAEVKKYSREISILFKINGYNPEFDEFFNFFNLEDFMFIPCIDEGLRETADADTDDYDDFENDAVVAINSAYDSSTRVNLDDLEEYAKNKNEPINVLLEDLIDRKHMDSDSFVAFVNSCGSEIQRKLVSWIFNKV